MYLYVGMITVKLVNANKYKKFISKIDELKFKLNLPQIIILLNKAGLLENIILCYKFVLIFRNCFAPVASRFLPSFIQTCIVLPPLPVERLGSFRPGEKSE